MSTHAPFDKIALIGLGLIGSSIARACLALGLAREVAVTDASNDVRERARQILLTAWQ